MSGDLRDVADINKMVSEIFNLHPDGVDILVNNAGWLKIRFLETVDSEMRCQCPVFLLGKSQDLSRANQSNFSFFPPILTEFLLHVLQHLF